MTLPTEPIGSIPRPKALQEGMQAAAAGRISAEALDALFDDAVRDTLRRFEATGSPVVTDGEQRKPSFATYPVAGLPLAPGGVVIPFEDGHTRQLPVLTTAPFRYATKAYEYLDAARPMTTTPLKQAVISASAISLMYPGDGIAGYPREAFIEDLVSEAASEIRGCIERGATVQIDFTEARLSLKLDPSGGLLGAFVDLNNAVLDRLSDAERAKVGVHSCPGGDQDSTHSADIDYLAMLPTLFGLHVDRFFVELASETDRERVLRGLGEHATGSRRDLRRRDRPDRPARSRRPRRSATACSRRRGSSIRTTSARPTTAGSRRSATTRRRRATRPSPRSRPGSPGRRWRRACSGSEARALGDRQSPAPGGSSATLSQRSPVARRRTKVVANGDARLSWSAPDAS